MEMREVRNGAEAAEPASKTQKKVSFTAEALAADFDEDEGEDVVVSSGPLEPGTTTPWRSSDEIDWAASET